MACQSELQSFVLMSGLGSSYHTSQRSAEVAGSRFLIVWQAEIAGEIWKSLVDRVGRGVNDLESDASGRGVGC